MTDGTSDKIAQVNSVLLRIKHLAGSNPDCFTVASHREKNEQTMLLLGYKDKHVIEEILTLTYKNYCQGPDDNISKSGEQKGHVWIFGKEIAEMEIYIKIHIITTKRETECICVSFHEPAYPLRYPLR